MKRALVAVALVGLLAASHTVVAGVPEKVVDIPSRSGVTQRFVYVAPDNPKAAVILYAGGHGGLQIDSGGNYGWGKGNFLVRTRQLFAEQGLAVAVIDAPSDRQQKPFLNRFRQTPEHLADTKAVIAWLKQQTKLPVWVIGTSRGTQSAAYIATEAKPADGGPDGVVLTSTILSDPRGRPVPDMPLEKITVPVLVAHHEQDGCKHCPYRDVPQVMNKLTSSPRKELISFKGGEDVGDPCEARGHHGFAGIEKEVVTRIAAWIVAK